MRKSGTLTAALAAIFVFAMIAPAVADSHAGITSPEMDEIVYTDTLYLSAYDTTAVNGDVNWAVRTTSCEANPDNNVAGNVTGVDDDYSWDAEGNFSAMLDVSTWSPGWYCFVFNPTDTGTRLTQGFYLVDDYVKVGGTLYMGELGKGNSPTHALDGLVGDAGSAGIVGWITVSYRELGETMSFTPDTLSFHTATGAGASATDGDAKAIIMTEGGTQIQVLDRDASPLYPRGAFILRSEGSPSDGPYEIDATPGTTGADSWVPMDRGNNHVYDGS